jgi:hypothetical protein
MNSSMKKSYYIDGCILLTRIPYVDFQYSLLSLPCFSFPNFSLRHAWYIRQVSASITLHSYYRQVEYGQMPYVV